MSIDETPIDCFKMKCFIFGTEEEIAEEREKYIKKFPYMSYGTVQKETTDDGIVMVRFRYATNPRQGLHPYSSRAPVGAEVEKGKPIIPSSKQHLRRQLTRT